MKKIFLPLLATFIAILVTTTMDFTGLTIFSALPLILITGLFWFLNKLTKTDFGWKWGKLSDYGLALFYPAVVLILTTGIAYILGALNPDTEALSKAGINILVASTIGTLMVMITEEGFFRGWLWGSIKTSAFSAKQTLFITSGLFTLWHISAVVSGTDYGLPFDQVPVYLVNATLLGLNWGLMRHISGSVLVPAVSHAVWNGLMYELYGFGEKTGALGVADTFLLGPEVGFLGILLNLVFFIWLYRKADLPQEVTEPS